MTKSRDDRIRLRAVEIWEAEGRPLNAHERHWLQAIHDIDAEDVAALKGEKVPERSDPPTHQHSGRPPLNHRRW